MKKRAPEPELHSWKPRAPELEPCLRKKSSGAGAVSFLRLRTPQRQGRIQREAIAPLEPTQITLVVILYNSENSIRDKAILSSLVWHSSVVKCTSVLLQ